jgi:hypothetical protein
MHWEHGHMTFPIALFGVTCMFPVAEEIGKPLSTLFFLIPLFQTLPQDLWQLGPVR